MGNFLKLILFSAFLIRNQNAQNQIVCKKDLILIIDNGNGPVEADLFLRYKSLALNIIQKIAFGLDGVQFALVLYNNGTTPLILHSLKQGQSAEAINTAVSTLTPNPTNPRDPLDHVILGRSDATKVVVVMSEGNFTEAWSNVIDDSDRILVELYQVVLDSEPGQTVFKKFTANGTLTETVTMETFNELLACKNSPPQTVAAGSQCPSPSRPVRPVVLSFKCPQRVPCGGTTVAPPAGVCPPCPRSNLASPPSASPPTNFRPTPVTGSDSNRTISKVVDFIASEKVKSDCPADILVALDSSAETNRVFSQQMDVIFDIVDSLDFGSRLNQFGLIETSGQPNQLLQFSFDAYSNPDNLISTLRSLPKFESPSGTAKALRFAKDMLEGRRSNVPAIIFLFTNGIDGLDDFLEPAKSLQSELDVFIFAISIGSSFNKSALAEITGNETRVLIEADEQIPFLKNKISKILTTCWFLTASSSLLTVSPETTQIIRKNLSVEVQPLVLPVLTSDEFELAGVKNGTNLTQFDVNPTAIDLNGVEKENVKQVFVNIATTTTTTSATAGRSVSKKQKTRPTGARFNRTRPTRPSGGRITTAKFATNLHTTTELASAEETVERSPLERTISSTTNSDANAVILTNSSGASNETDTKTTQKISDLDTTTTTLESKTELATAISTKSTKKCLLDILFIIDASGSVEKIFRKELKLIADIVQKRLVISDDNARVALIKFAGAGHTRVVFPFDKYNTTDALIRVIENTGFISGTTFTNEALDGALSLYKDSKSGSRSGRAQFLVIIFTDGYSQRSPKESAQKLIDLGAHIMVYADDMEQPINEEGLIQTSGSNSSVYKTSALNEFNPVLDKLEKSCKSGISFEGFDKGDSLQTQIKPQETKVVVQQAKVGQRNKEISKSNNDSTSALPLLSTLPSLISENVTNEQVPPVDITNTNNLHKNLTEVADVSQQLIEPINLLNNSITWDFESFQLPVSQDGNKTGNYSAPSKSLPIGTVLL